MNETEQIECLLFNIRFEFPRLKRKIGVPIHGQTETSQAASSKLNGKFFFVKLWIMYVTSAPSTDYVGVLFRYEYSEEKKTKLFG